MSRGRSASLPPAGLPPGSWDRSTGTLRVVLSLEDVHMYTLDFSRMKGPVQMRRDFAAAIASWASSARGIRRSSTIQSKRKAVSSFLRWVDSLNEATHLSHQQQVESVSDLTAFHLKQFAQHLERTLKSSTAFEYYTDAALLIRHSPGASAEILREARKRKGDPPAPTTPILRYPPSEFVEIKNAARRVVEAAHARIQASFELATLNEDSESDHQAAALRDVLRYGRPQTPEDMAILGGTRAAIARGGGQAPARRLLFLSPDEALAAGVLVACQRGLNLAPIVNAPTPVEHEPGVIQLNLDKPRRGANARFWPEIVSENEDATEGSARIIRLIAEATEPARQYLAWNGRPADRLLIYWPFSSSEPKFGLPVAAARSRAPWLPNGTTLNFPRLRRSVPGHGVIREPTDHSPDTHLTYIRSDLESLAHSQEEASQAVARFRDHARASLAVRVAENRDTSESKDAVLVNCSDPEHKPGTGAPCVSGYYSFLDCLDCSNAATVPRLIPRQLAAVQVLETLRDTLGETWERRFARRYFLLRAVLDRHTPAEIEDASSRSAVHIPLILAALRLEAPA